MPDTRDVPEILKEFNTIFNQLAYCHDYSTVFSDFLDVTIKGFSIDGDFDEFNSYLKNRYKLEEREMFTLLFQEWIKVMDRGVNNAQGWFDALGIYYEVLAGRSKKSALGQFFTPDHVCDLMVMVTGEDITNKLVNDPTCGSGRLLLSHHVKNLGNYYWAEDLDPICCKMTVLNFLIHGVVGVVINHDSLLQGDFRGAWIVNESLNQSHLPTIRKIDKEELNMVYYYWRILTGGIFRSNHTPVPMEAPTPSRDSEPVPVGTFEEVEQLTLF